MAINGLSNSSIDLNTLRGLGGGAGVTSGQVTNSFNGGGIVGGGYNSGLTNLSGQAVAYPDGLRYDSSNISSPTYYPPESYFYGSGQRAGSAADVQASQNTQAQYNDLISQLQSQTGQLDNQQNIGLGNIGNSYNLGVNRLGEQEAAGRRDIGLQKQNNTNAYSQNRTGVLSGARSGMSALQRLLGMAGAGNSSAALQAAPYAVGFESSKLLRGAQNVYGQNAQGIDIREQDFNRNIGNTREDLGRQKFQQENSLKSSIAEKRASLLDRIASATAQRDMAGGADYQTAMNNIGGMRGQVTDLLSQITALGNQYANPVLQAGNVAYEAPDLGQYTGPLTNGISQGPGQGNVDPIFNPIFNRERDQFGRMVG